MAQSDTVTRILDTAEALFAERGFAETSLRTITGKARVNLAAVNYHFGSKKALIQAVFARYLDPFCAHFNAALDELETQQQAPDLETLLTTLAKTTLSVPASKGSLSVFMRLLGLAYTQAQGHMRRYLQDHYGDTFVRFVHLFREATQELPEAERFWRMHFMLGSVVFTMSSLDALKDMAAADLNEKTRVQDIVQRLVPFLAEGMRADPVDTALFTADA
ncbi:TetR family transcriptional regulator [Terasakiispira papahanaumokuakeensis]|uniref:TetR family transcriptional regulator n=1 Tax=Terasakiispira papahanaumokuakeensis TaxID=197479 RepID=A0A1E2V7G0_9GAMM|nr:TetR/AcrR family transcriptional regulator [Terasakiispira papahanaumokuakeensis]ODC02950.1 TetR family transcriptional regulator [Terasakiispira papahanaumokuakeensis]